MFLWCIISEFERKVDAQDHPFGKLRSKNWFKIKKLRRQKM